MSTTYSKHITIIDKIKSSMEVDNVIEIWECEYNNLIKTNSEFADFVKNEGEIRPALQPRESLTGGRTNAIVLCHEGYVDFTSLYPYIQKYGAFPIGHPEIITQNFKSLENYFGIIYCRIVPPEDLFLPVLPFRSNNKLVFPLCSKCAVENIKKCNHSDEERALENTWVILEVLEALKIGYRILKIFEIWNYPKQECYDSVNRTGGLFTEYVNTFLKIKQEASGFPAWVKTEEDKNKYINEYFEHEGILLSKEKVLPNPGLKALSKLLLNSQWVRYAMNTHKTKCKFIKNPHELFNIIYNIKFDVKDIIFPNDNIGICFFSDKTEVHIDSNQTNVVIASFVTAQARLKLYSELRIWKKRSIF